MSKSNEKWVKGTVILRISPHYTNEGKTASSEVPCISKGCWAIHKGYNFAITHIPSGLKLKDLKTQRAAKALADELNDPRWNTEQDIHPHYTVIEESKPIIARYAEHF